MRAANSFGYTKLFKGIFRFHSRSWNICPRTKHHISQPTNLSSCSFQPNLSSSGKAGENHTSQALYTLSPDIALPSGVTLILIRRWVANSASGVGAIQGWTKWLEQTEFSVCLGTPIPGQSDPLTEADLGVSVSINDGGRTRDNDVTALTGLPSAPPTRRAGTSAHSCGLGVFWTAIHNSDAAQVVKLKSNTFEICYSKVFSILPTYILLYVHLCSEVRCRGEKVAPGRLLGGSSVNHSATRYLGLGMMQLGWNGLLQTWDEAGPTCPCWLCWAQLKKDTPDVRGIEERRTECPDLTVHITAKKQFWEAG